MSAPRTNARAARPPSLLAAMALAACAQTTAATQRDAAVIDAPVVTDAPAVIDAPVVTDIPVVTDVPAVRDTAVASDGPAHGGECRRASDCTNRPLFENTFAQGWSCVQGRCTWEQRRGRTCVRAPDGCYDCDDGARGCPGEACVASLRREDVRIERAYCARDFLASLRACAGGFVELDDMVCTLTDAPTGAIRWVLACGPCEFVFTPR